jgi:23S rRNA pseudouridine2605 synthase
LREGKNREVRRLLESIELRVMRLIRVSFGPFQLGNLEAGNIEEIKQRNLKEQLGVIDGTVQNYGRAESKKRNLLKTKDKKRNADRSRSPSRR